jgi:RimJ/RimL family protein N-acetyltransferase
MSKDKDQDTGGNQGARAALGDDQPLLQGPLTAASIADRVHRALDAADLDEIAALLSPDVQWGAPGDPTPPCRARDQVLRWYAKGRAKGRRATVTEVEVHGNALLVGMTLEDGQERWQVMRVGPEGVNDIRGYQDRPSAVEKLSR